MMWQKDKGSTGVHPSIIYTVAICTRNRAALLNRTLGILTKQVLRFSDTEIIVVDNNSSDNTAEVVAYFPDVRYLLEEKLGIAWGRNRAAKDGYGKWLLYVDDDAFPIPEWFQVMRQTIENATPPLHSVADVQNGSLPPMNLSSHDMI